MNGWFTILFGGSDTNCKSMLYDPLTSSLVIRVICKSVGVVPLVTDVEIQLTEGLIVAVHVIGLDVLVMASVRVTTGVP